MAKLTEQEIDKSAKTIMTLLPDGGVIYVEIVKRLSKGAWCIVRCVNDDRIVNITYSVGAVLECRIKQETNRNMINPGNPGYGLGVYIAESLEKKLGYKKIHNRDLP